MPDVTASGLNGGSASFTGDANLNAAGAYCLEAKIGGRSRELNFPSGPGVDGSGSKDYGFRKQRIRLKLLYVKSSPGACLSAWNSDVDVFSKGCDVTVDGTTYKACFSTGDSDELDQARPANGSLVRAEAMVVLEARRLT